MAAAAGAVDEAVREYLLFRGFAKTLQTFEAERKNDPEKGLQVGFFSLLFFLPSSFSSLFHTHTYTHTHTHTHTYTHTLSLFRWSFTRVHFNCFLLSSPLSSPSLFLPLPASFILSDSVAFALFLLLFLSLPLIAIRCSPLFLSSPGLVVLSLSLSLFYPPSSPSRPRPLASPADRSLYPLNEPYPIPLLHPKADAIVAQLIAYVEAHELAPLLNLWRHLDIRFFSVSQQTGPGMRRSPADPEKSAGLWRVGCCFRLRDTCFSWASSTSAHDAGRGAS